MCMHSQNCRCVTTSCISYAWQGFVTCCMFALMKKQVTLLTAAMGSLPYWWRESYQPKAIVCCTAALPAALHVQMERMNTVARVCKAGFKKPHSRTNTDVNCIAAETQHVSILSRGGPAVHRELCHVVQTLQLGQMESLRLPGDFKSGVFGYVSSKHLRLIIHRCT